MPILNAGTVVKNIALLEAARLVSQAAPLVSQAVPFIGAIIPTVESFNCGNPLSFTRAALVAGLAAPASGEKPPIATGIPQRRPQTLEACAVVSDAI